MKACEETTQRIKDSIQKYYRNQKAIEGQERRLERLLERLKGIESEFG